MRELISYISSSSAMRASTESSRKRTCHWCIHLFGVVKKEEKDACTILVILTKQNFGMCDPIFETLLSHLEFEKHPMA
jgi:hypothetical protein